MVRALKALALILTAVFLVGGLALVLLDGDRDHDGGPGRGFGKALGALMLLPIWLGARRMASGWNRKD